MLKRDTAFGEVTLLTILFVAFTFGGIALGYAISEYRKPNIAPEPLPVHTYLFVGVGTKPTPRS